MLMTFLFFCFDIFLLIKSVDNYLFSLLFILDIVGTFSLIFDMGWINRYVFVRTSMNVYGVLARGARSTLIANKLSEYLLFLERLDKVQIFEFS